MARYLDEISLDHHADLGQGGTDVLLQLGLMYATGRSVPADRVEAHKWFNLSASRGNAEAVRLRRELAIEMNEAEIATAQRAAREWLRTH